MDTGKTGKTSRSSNAKPAVVRARSATSGRYVTKATATRSPRSIVTESGSNRSSDTHHRSATTGKFAPGASGRARTASRAADDPLAPERTRWLADVLGGGGALARMLGVSSSQTSRWASGRERPGALTAPLLIDLEHVHARARLVWAEPAASNWLDSSNAHLSGATPMDVMRLEGVGPVLDALDADTWGTGA